MDIEPLVPLPSKSVGNKRLCEKARAANDAGLRSGGGPNDNSKAKQRDTSNAVKRGTFLTRLDTSYLRRTCREHVCAAAGKKNVGRAAATAD